MNIIYKNMKSLKKACYDKILDISYGMNSNTIEYNQQNKKYLLFLSIDSEFKELSYKKAKEYAESIHIIAKKG